MSIRTYAAKLLNLTPPTEPSRPPSPRAEPPNLGSEARAADAQAAVRLAERGETQQLFQLYRDSLLSDEYIQGCLNTRKLAVLGQPMSIMPRDKDSEEDQAAAAACRQAVDDCENWTDGLGALLDATLWPVAITEKLFRPADAPADDDTPPLQFTLRRLDAITPFLFCWRWAYQGGVEIDPNAFEPLLRLWPVDAVGLILRDPMQAIPLDPARHLVHRGHLLTGQRDNMGGPMRAVLGWWLLRALGRDWFARFMERYGMPFPKGKTNTKDPHSVAFLQEAFSLATKVGGIVIDQQDEVDLVQAIVQGGAEGHKLWHGVCNNAIRLAITGVSDNDRPGGINAGESQKSENVREDVRMFDQLRLCATLERQLFAPFLKINGLAGRIKLSFGGLSDSDAAKFATTLKTMSDAGWEPTDEAIPTLNDRLGLPVQRKATPPPPPAFGLPDNQGAGREALGARPETLAFSLQPSALNVAWLSAQSTASPVADIAGQHAAALAKVFRNQLAPVRQIILASSSRADCEAKLKTFFADWPAEKIAAIVEEAMQVCAAKGAAMGK